LKHFLIDCVDVGDVRQTFYNVNNVYDLITNIAVDTILKFFEEINLYAKIYGFIFLMFLLFVGIIRLFYIQVCFISKCLVCV